MTKYRAKPTMVGDIRFDSQAEARRYHELLLLNRAGVIRCLELQPEFPFKLNDKKLFTYRSDFRYLDDKGEVIIEDVKSEPTKTPIYRLKKKLIEEQHRIKITEVMA